MNSMTKGTIFTAGSLGDLPDFNQWPIWFTPKLILIINHACRRFITRYAKGVDGKIVQRFYRALRDAWLHHYRGMGGVLRIRSAFPPPLPAVIGMPS